MPRLRVNSGTCLRAICLGTPLVEASTRSFDGSDSLAGLRREVLGVSFQITILKVLAGSPGGLLPLADLRRDVSILISSGRDWTDRTKRIAAQAPGLDIFSQALVGRDAAGWWITRAGLELLATIERPAPGPAPRVEVPAAVEPVGTAAPPVPLIGINPRRSRRRRSKRNAPRSAVA
jgi:hypothetical protein